MKRLLLCLSLCGILISLHAQNVVNWKYSAKKIADKTYEIHLTATVQNPWHIYSQFTPGGGPVPTRIIFSKNPLTNLEGNVMEVGKMNQKHEEVFGVDVKYFDSNVDFVQVVKLKTKVKTNIAGAIEYMTCNDEQCLPPKTINFSVKLE